MDCLQLIRTPIENDLGDFNALFRKAMSHTDGMLSEVLAHILKRKGKQMRPMLILLMARNYGDVTQVTQNAAVGLELLHTASLVHDDVVDESGERRGQASVNAMYDNKVAVLTGDYLLSTALLHVSYTGENRLVTYLAELGRTLAQGEILQLSNIRSRDLSEDVYFQVIRQKTAALFEACCTIGAVSGGATDEEIEAAKLFGQNLGIIFQIRDDIFDYFDSADIGKPTGNDMAEGKLTLPVLYALKSCRHESLIKLAYKVKDRTVNSDEIACLVDFTKAHGGIEYAEKRMMDFHAMCLQFINTHVQCFEIKNSLTAYLDFVMNRDK